MLRTAANTSPVSAGKGGASELLPGVDDALHLDLAQLLQRQRREVRLVRRVQRFDGGQGGILYDRVRMGFPDLVDTSETGLEPKETAGKATTKKKKSKIGERLWGM